MKTEQQQRNQPTKKGARPGPRPEAPPTPRTAGPGREPEPSERAENEGMARSPDSGDTSRRLEGEREGGYSATHHREGLEHSAKMGDAEQLADEAARALDGPEGRELRHAEHNAKQGHASPPPVHKKTH